MKLQALLTKTKSIMQGQRSAQAHQSAIATGFRVFILQISVDTGDERINGWSEEGFGLSSP